MILEDVICLWLNKQINEVLCYFRHLDASTQLKLLYSLCSSLYGVELWDLSSCDVEVVDYYYMGHFSFRGGSFQKLYTYMNCSNNGVDFCVINLLNKCILLRDHQLLCSGLDISRLNCIISYLCCS